ncbi:MAG: DNA polymerase IV [Clostridia bacterium]|nr:DNA polymerase IV [Clostridia bacterium]
MDRVILHVDCNKFFASVECLHRPEIRHLPVAVGGSVEKRHGIVLTANGLASARGVKTAMPLWQALNRCPDLVVVPPNYPLYVRFSGLAKSIYCRYTDMVEPFGLDECWLDVTDNVKDIEEGRLLAEEIRQTIKDELGITVSIGVSWNKVFSKLGSDYKKPDAVTVFTRENYKNLIYPLPVRDLLYIGPATEKKLLARGLFSIGDIAESTPEELCSFLGINGYMLHSFASGSEDSPVKNCEHKRGIKSIGNSVTAPRDLVCFEDVKLTFSVLSETVARRLRDSGLKAKSIGISMRNSELKTITRQLSLSFATASERVLLHAAMELFENNTDKPFKIRSIGICAFNLEDENGTVQFDLFGEVKENIKYERLEKTVDRLRCRFGNNCVKKASQMTDMNLTDFDPYEEHKVHPEGWFRL